MYTSLTSLSGNPNLAIRIIKNMSQSMNLWENYLDNKPDFESKEQFDSDVIAMNQRDLTFRAKCGTSCILLITVDGYDSKVTSHYNIQASRDLLELSDGNRI